MALASRNVQVTLIRRANAGFVLEGFRLSNSQVHMYFPLSVPQKCYQFVKRTTNQHLSLHDGRHKKHNRISSSILYQQTLTKHLLCAMCHGGTQGVNKQSLGSCPLGLPIHQWTDTQTASAAGWTVSMVKASAWGGRPGHGTPSCLEAITTLCHGHGQCPSP